MPVTPQNEAGWRIEPPVSVPVAAGARPRGHGRGAAARRAAGNARGSQGLRTGTAWSKPSAGTATFSLAEPIANSSQLSLPSVTAPASASLRTTVASKGER